MRKRLLVLSLLLISGASAEEIPEVQVTATRVEVPVEHVGDDVDIITQEEIKKYGFTSIADVLKYVAGVHISSNGGFGQTTSVYMLGLPTKYILVMIDGVPVNDPSSIDSQANFVYIDLNNVERIEVLKGAQGALYGSEAIAGVINIITKKPDKNELKLNFEGGKYKTFKENLYSALKLKDGYLSLSFENFKTNGFSATNDKSPNYESDSDKYSYRSGWISYGWNLTDTVKITGNFKLKEGTVEYDSSWTPDAYTTYNNYFAGVKIDKIFSDNFMITTKLSNNKEVRNYGRDIIGITRYVSIQPIYYLLDNLFLTGGINYKQEITNTSGAPNLHTKSAFFEIHTDYLGVHNTFAIRRDFHSQFGAKTTYKVSSAYDFKETGTTLKGQYGTGFKAPNISQLYGYGGNPDLRPEISEGWILGIKQGINFQKLNGNVEVNYFKNHVWDMIDWYPPGSWTGSYRNVNKATTEGAEVKINADITDWLNVYGTYTHLHTSKDLRARRPEISYTLGFNSVYQKIKFSAWAEHYSDREDSNGKTLPSFTTYNCYASYQLNDRVNFYLKGINLTDKDYELAYGYNTMGRAFFAGVNLNFR
ncbi:TonB-dependent receptor plug [Desulfurobacterium thermolithotrophum DSM 11699]|uniref:TonB-dependent receptor plug n=1 Tax=Desulfurobacterium thermolithotrophum (strain DSM 11699 / BSA) TaxID=868864 RepID=F0S0W3_DESTD|nr:TonB-dependent receptor [Desulfurobacterium thermolithotrophum]ADY72767.1 TonB-dependent receptor plug [Desulfurobacterium thermolithotrophum DSM 11699]